MAFDLYSIFAPKPHDDEVSDVPGALRYGTRGYLGLQALTRIADRFFPSQLDQDSLAEQKLRNRLMARQMMLDDDEVDEMAHGPSFGKQLQGRLVQSLISQAMRK